MTCTSESPMEASTPTNLLTTKPSTRIGTWNIRTLYDSGRINEVASEMRKYKIKSEEKKVLFNCEVNNKFEVLAGLVTDETLEQHCLTLQEIWKSTCTDVLGRKTKQHKQWLSAETWDKIQERKELKEKINQCQNEEQKANLRTQYGAVNKSLRKNARDDKKRFLREMTVDAEKAAEQRDMKRLYDITRTLAGRNTNTSKPVKDKQGKIITSDVGQKDRWAEHFQEILNRHPPESIPDIPPTTEEIDFNTGPPTKGEIIKAIKNAKKGKAPGPDGIPVEALKADPKISAEMLHPLLWKQ
ncbi:craniofacial development protein 2 [Biomphalaria glabrata]